MALHFSFFLILLLPFQVNNKFPFILMNSQ